MYDLITELFDILSSSAGTESFGADTQSSANRREVLDIAWAAGLYANAMRNAGSYGHAAGYMDFAFSLESRNECFETRAFLYRCAAYLCAEVEMLDIGEAFATNALLLSQGTENPRGLSESLLLMAQVTFWRRDLDDSERYLLGATAQLVSVFHSSPSTLSNSVLHRAIALQHLWTALAKQDLEHAAVVLHSRVSPLMDDPSTPDPDAGKLYLGTAVLHSYCGEVDAADAAFRNARALLSHPSDQAALALWEGRHKLRHSTSSLTGDLAEVVMIGDRLTSPRATRILSDTAERFVQGKLDTAALTRLAWSFMGLRQPDEEAAA